MINSDIVKTDTERINTRKIKRKDNHIHVAFVGNPNCGKTTLFNALTGSKLKVANWPGVTVEKKEGSCIYDGFEVTLVDTPGIYSLTSYTIEEKITRQCVLDDDVEVIVNVVDASSLERNLYLTLQLLEIGKPVVLALNMMDIVEETGIELDLHRLPELLGDIPVVPVSAAKRSGMDILLHAVVHHYEEGPQNPVILYSGEIEEKIEKLEIMMQAHYPKHSSPRWHAIKLLEYDEDVREEHPIHITNIADKNYEKDIIQSKYRYIENVIKEVVFHKEKKVAFTDKVDRILIHPIWGVPVFFLIMTFVFFLTFTVGDFLKSYFEFGVSFFSNIVSSICTSAGVSPWLISLLVNGIIAGVGGILTFVPNIAILFLALALLEDSGYMSRVAYIMDKIMGKVGLSGKAFLPMILGFGCTVPAIMATRALESEKDRRKTMVLTPFMSCSAKLPIYVLFSGIFFKNYATLVAMSMYVIGMLLAIVVAFLMNKFQKGSENDSLLIELPEYKRPNARTIRIYVMTKLKDFLIRAGTTIFIASIIIWFLLNFGAKGMVTNPGDSFGAFIGKLMVPLLAPAGLGMWQIGVALLSGITAKEIVVSSMNVLFGVTTSVNMAGAASGVGTIADRIHAFNPGFGPLNAYSMMLFCLLYIPCVASIVTIQKESHFRMFTFKVLCFQMIIAWLVSVIFFQTGTFLLGN